jgi:hypothetical protein
MRISFHWTDGEHVWLSNYWNTGMMKDEQITLELTNAEALVLFEWLARVDSSKLLPFEDQAEQEVLWRVECMLERLLVEPFEPNYAELLAEARRRVRDST